MGSYDHLPLEERDLAADVDAVLAPLLRGMAGHTTAPSRRSDEALPRRFRVVVATDWNAATVPFLVLQAYARIIPSDAPVDLVFAVPHAPNRRDLAAARLLRQSLAPGLRVAGIAIETFDDACDRHAMAAVVPTGDTDLLMRDVVLATTTFHELAHICADLDRLDEHPAPADGPNTRLRRRFDAYLATRPVEG